MAYEGKVISGDCHIDIPWLPADLFVTQGPAHLKDRMPRVEDTANGKQWVADGAYVGWVAGAGVGARAGAWDPYVPGISKRMDRMEEERFFSDGAKGLFHPTDPRPSNQRPGHRWHCRRGDLRRPGPRRRRAV